MNLFLREEAIEVEAAPAALQNKGRGKKEAGDAPERLFFFLELRSKIKEGKKKKLETHLKRARGTHLG